MTVNILLRSGRSGVHFSKNWLMRCIHLIPADPDGGRPRKRGIKWWPISIVSPPRTLLGKRQEYVSTSGDLSVMRASLNSSNRASVAKPIDASSSRLVNNSLPIFESSVGTVLRIPLLKSKAWALASHWISDANCLTNSMLPSQIQLLKLGSSPKTSFSYNVRCLHRKISLFIP